MMRPPMPLSRSAPAAVAAVAVAVLARSTVAAEFARIARATGLGFLMMGFIGFFVKLIHIPINNILMGAM